jgi:hypothetical protein
MNQIEHTLAQEREDSWRWGYYIGFFCGAFFIAVVAAVILWVVS